MGLPGQTKPRGRHVNPPQVIMFSFAAMILTGTLLLSLPVASNSGESVGLINALFTATSANCVTGLVVVNTLEHWTMFGQVVILLLIQLGGLGLISILTFGMVLLRYRISLENRLLVQAAFNQDNIGGMVRLVKIIVKTTLVFEAAGAVLLAPGFYFSTPGMGVGEAIWKGVFHSISAFCNAGFDILGPDSLVPYRGNLFINLVFMALIIAGGLGFIVWAELIARPAGKARRSPRRRWQFLSLHGKIALVVTAVLVVSGTLLFLLLEWGNPDTLGPLPPAEKVLAALFQSVTLRTCGFNSISQSGLTEPSQLLSCMFMYIGGSPAGTAGGIKTVTLGVVVIAMLSVLRGKRKLEAFQRTLPLDLLLKSLTVACALLIVVLGATFVLWFTEAGGPIEHTILDLLFESVSAAGTVGVSTGITPYLSTAGKIVITITMFLGRISPVTVVVALNMRLKSNGGNISYPHERVIIG